MRFGIVRTVLKLKILYYFLFPGAPIRAFVMADKSQQSLPGDSIKYIIAVHAVALSALFQSTSIYLTANLFDGAVKFLVWASDSATLSYIGPLLII